MGIERLFTQIVSLETYLGTGTFGDVYADPVDVACYLEDAIREVRNTQGDQVVSTARIYASLNTAPDDPSTAGQFAVGSKVTAHGRTALVLSVARYEVGPVNARHIEVALT